MGILGWCVLFGGESGNCAGVFGAFGGAGLVCGVFGVFGVFSGERGSWADELDVPSPRMSKHLHSALHLFPAAPKKEDVVNVCLADK